MRRVAALIVVLLPVLTATSTAQAASSANAEEVAVSGETAPVDFKTLVASSAGADDFPQFTGEDFKTLVGVALEELPGLRPPGEPGVITGNSSLDSRIWDLAFARGYEMRPTAIASNLVTKDGLLMQPLAAQAWADLKKAAADAGHSLWAKSTYRSVAAQRSIFRRRLLGTSDSAINATLAYHSVPGTSRHHTGYAFDITLPGRQLWQFEGTAAHRWLTRDNYYNAKRFGFVPSYPPGVSKQGPNPEPWEFVYVGLDILAGDRVFLDVGPSHFAGEAILWMHENGYTSGCSDYFFCPADDITRSELAAFMHRVLGATLGPGNAHPGFADTSSHFFAANIDWLAAVGITKGCNPPANTVFCPDSHVSRGEMAAMTHRGLIELIAVDESEIDPDRFVDAFDSIFRADIAWMGASGITKGCNPPANDRYCPSLELTRADVAVFLQRITEMLAEV